MDDYDVITVLMMRVREALPSNYAPELRRIEAEVRLIWAGDRCYISNNPNKKNRNDYIIKAWKNGKALYQIAYDNGLSERRIRQIINSRQQKN